jgi:hypothetical protein
MKFTDEELSLIMDAHESEKLSKYGALHRGSCCLLMAAIGADDSLRGWNYDEWYKRLGEDESNTRIGWFGYNYQSSWTTDEFLAQLEAQGWA